jgi:hypothetical protein
VLAYHVTVAAADNWSGAVSNLGRYVMPVLPWLAAFVTSAVAAAGRRRGALALVLALCGWTAVLAGLLWQDPHAANDSARLLAGAVVADGDVYVPNLFFRSPQYGAPGTLACILGWFALAALLGSWLKRVARGRGGDSPARALAGAIAVTLFIAFVLERWPGAHRAPRFPGTLGLGPGVVAFVSGSVVEDGLVRAQPGGFEVLVRSTEPLAALAVTAAGEGVLRVAGRPPALLRPSGVTLHVPLREIASLTGRRGARETLARRRMTIESAGPVALRLAAVPRAGVASGGGLR